MVTAIALKVKVTVQTSTTFAVDILVRVPIFQGSMAFQAPPFTDVSCCAAASRTRDFDKASLCWSLNICLQSLRLISCKTVLSQILLFIVQIFNDFFTILVM